MAKSRKRKKARKKERRDGFTNQAYVVDRLFFAIDGDRGADPQISPTARLLRRGPQQIAKKLGEEAVEAMIEGLTGNRSRLVLESTDVLYHLLALWAINGIKPDVVWRELARREELSAATRRRAFA
jgi:phosphoribosyl-ATP pyrophosphohydrolase